MQVYYETFDEEPRNKDFVTTKIVSNSVKIQMCVQNIVLVLVVALLISTNTATNTATTYRFSFCIPHVLFPPACTRTAIASSWCISDAISNAVQGGDFFDVYDDDDTAFGFAPRWRRVRTVIVLPLFAA